MSGKARITLSNPLFGDSKPNVEHHSLATNGEQLLIAIGIRKLQIGNTMRDYFNLLGWDFEYAS